jgi:DNA-binding protein
MAKNIPGAPAERLLRNAGAQRVSDKARLAMADVIEEIAREISEQAVKIAKNCGRKTVHEGDIKMVRL